MNKTERINHYGNSKSIIYVLAVSQNQKTLAFLRNQINSDAINLIAAESQEQALKVIQENPFITTLFIDSDILKEQSDHFVMLTQQMRQHNFTPKIVCAGTQKSFDNIKIAMQYGAIDYICIPIDRNELINSIHRSLQLLDFERIHERYLQKIDQRFVQLQDLFKQLKQQQTQHQNPIVYDKNDEVKEPALKTHSINPYLKKALKLSQLQLQDHQNNELPQLISTAWRILLEIFNTEMSGQIPYVTTVSVGTSIAVSSTHRHLDVLQNHNLIRRQRDASDKRRIRVQLTPKGNALVIGFIEQI